MVCLWCSRPGLNPRVVNDFIVPVNSNTLYADHESTAHKKSKKKQALSESLFYAFRSTLFCCLCLTELKGWIDVLEKVKVKTMLEPTHNMDINGG